MCVQLQLGNYWQESQQMGMEENEWWGGVLLFHFSEIR
jgi:hypothetical protein